MLRSAHGVEPTEFGRAALLRARVVDSELRKMQEDIDALAGGHAAAVSVGISSTAEALLLARAVSQARKQLPNTLLGIVGGPFATTVAALRESRADFAIGSVPPTLQAADLEKERLLGTDLVTHAPLATFPAISDGSIGAGDRGGRGHARRVNPRVQRPEGFPAYLRSLFVVNFIPISIIEMK